MRRLDEDMLKLYIAASGCDIPWTEDDGTYILDGVIDLWPGEVEVERGATMRTEEVEGWLVGTTKVVSNYPHEPDDADVVVLSSHEHMGAAIAAAITEVLQARMARAEDWLAEEEEARPDTTIPVIVCCGTNGRAVLYGRAESEPVAGQPIRLTGARMVLYWSAACGGLLGLAARGPQEGTRITAAAVALGDECVRQWVAVSPEAAKAIDRWPAC